MSNPNYTAFIITLILILHLHMRAYITTIFIVDDYRCISAASLKYFALFILDYKVLLIEMPPYLSLFNASSIKYIIFCQQFIKSLEQCYSISIF